MKASIHQIISAALEGDETVAPEVRDSLTLVGSPTSSPLASASTQLTSRVGRRLKSKTLIPPSDNYRSRLTTITLPCF